jgi:diaminopimelate epimerase
MVSGPVDFAKMAGGGNDFVVIDNRAGLVTDPGALAEAICTRRLSVGADGLILVETSSSADVRMIYYNRDGSRADFCANGTRCAARFAVLAGMARPDLTLETDYGRIPATVAGGKVTLRLSDPAEFAEDFPLVLGENRFSGSRIVIGVPHYVVFVGDELWTMDVITPGKAIRYHPRLAPLGANANFVHVTGRNRIEVRTYERGVEDETLSCGSGVVASVSVSALTGQVESPVSVLTRSGIEYQVAFADGVRSLSLSGDARVIYRSTVNEETLTGFDPRWVLSPTSAKRAT